MSSFEIRCTGSSAWVHENPENLTCNHDDCNALLEGKIFILEIEWPSKTKFMCFCSKKCYKSFHDWMDREALKIPELIGIFDGGIPDDF